MDIDRRASLHDRLEATFWERHSNPKSGWSRVLLAPLFMLALYRRDRRLVALAVVSAVVNPVMFPRPDPDTESWMTRGVRAERWWLAQGHGTLSLDWPNVLNSLNIPVFAYALYSAYMRKPARAALGLALSMGLKVGWIEVISRQYDVSTTKSDRNSFK